MECRRIRKIIDIVPIFFLLMFLWFCGMVWGEEVRYGTASWYSVESCKREGTSGVMANGEKLNDTKYICASWDYAFGTLLNITNLQNGKSIVVCCKDRGPARRLYKKGRIIDLSKVAFRQLAELKEGIIKVKVEVIEDKEIQSVLGVRG